MPIKVSRSFLLLFVIPTFVFSFSNPVYQANFSGIWSLNEGKSELGQSGLRGSATKIVIDQKTDAVTITKTVTGPDGNPVSITETLHNDGKETETVLPSNKRISYLKWAANGNLFTIHFTIPGDSYNFQGTETWELSADGKMLTIQRNIKLPQVNITNKFVYDKQ
jgi:hypothetical protein